jgi:hypothetical protein
VGSLESSWYIWKLAARLVFTGVKPAGKSEKMP